MKLKITLKKSSSLIPFQYQHYLQGLFYSCFEQGTASYMHDTGHAYKDRHYKMFTFSLLEGHYHIQNQMLCFDTPITFYVTSIYADILNQIYASLMEKEEIMLGSNSFKIESITPITKEEVNEGLNTYIIKTLSPLICYTTDEKRYVTYYDPHSVLFETLVEKNLSRKYASLYQKEPIGESFKINKVIKSKGSVYRYKGLTFKGYMCTLEVIATHDFMTIALHAGLGTKNGSGFGMVEIQ